MVTTRYADQAKGKKAIAVPLNEDALVVIRQQIGKYDTHVFAYEGSPVTCANNHAWRKALIELALMNFAGMIFKASLGRVGTYRMGLCCMC